jgi:hypothetical protein
VNRNIFSVHDRCPSGITCIRYTLSQKIGKPNHLKWLWCLTPLSTIFQLYRRGLLVVDLVMLYIPECKNQLRNMKWYTQIRDIAHFKSGLYNYYFQKNVFWPLTLISEKLHHIFFWRQNYFERTNIAESNDIWHSRIVFT